MVKEFFIQGIFIICKLNCVEYECQFLTNCSLNNEERNTFFGVFVHNISIFILETFLKKNHLKRLFTSTIITLYNIKVNCIYSYQLEYSLVNLSNKMVFFIRGSIQKCEDFCHNYVS